MGLAEDRERALADFDARLDVVLEAQRAELVARQALADFVRELRGAGVTSVLLADRAAPRLGQTPESARKFLQRLPGPVSGSDGP